MNLSPPKQVIIYSHGFGVERDARGMFTDIAATFPDAENVLFNYNIKDQIENTLTVRPLSEQRDLLLAEIARVKERFPSATINIIAHSLGCIVAALAEPIGIRKVIFLAPPLEINTASLDRFVGRPGSVIDLSGLSRFARRDGSFTLVPAAFWQERAVIDPLALFNAFAGKAELTIIFANQDDVVATDKKHLLTSHIGIVSIDGDHDFRFKSRPELIKTVQELLSE